MVIDYEAWRMQYCDHDGSSALLDVETWIPRAGAGYSPKKTRMNSIVHETYFDLGLKWDLPHFSTSVTFALAFEHLQCTISIGLSRLEGLHEISSLYVLSTSISVGMSLREAAANITRKG